MLGLTSCFNVFVFLVVLELKYCEILLEINNYDTDFRLIILISRCHYTTEGTHVSTSIHTWIISNL